MDRDDSRELIDPSTLQVGESGELPDGQWRAAMATRFDRSSYIFTVDTTATDDAALVAAFNALPNESSFNFFYRNCSDQAKSILDLILPDIDVIGDRTDGVTMQTRSAPRWPWRSTVTPNGRHSRFSTCTSSAASSRSRTRNEPK